MSTRWRWLSPALFVLSLLAFAAPAFAGWKLDDKVKWRHFGRGDIGFSENGFATATSTPISPRGSDTLWVSAAPARVDTTSEWSMLDCDTEPLTTQGANTADSLAAAYFIIAADSNVASTVNFKNTTVTFQVNYGFNAGNWQTIFGAAISTLPTDGTKTLIVPIFRRLAAITTDLGIDLGHPGDAFAPRMRALVTWGTAAAAPQCRIRIKKWAGGYDVKQEQMEQY